MTEQSSTSVGQIDVLRAAMQQRDHLLVQAFALCRQWALAEDVVQEAFLLAAERWQDVEDVPGVKPWIRRIVHYKAMEMVRREQRHHHTVPMSMDTLEAVGAVMADADALDGSGTRMQAMKQALQDCFEGLQPEHRRLLTQFYWKRRSCEELAEEFARRPDNLRAMLSRLRKRLMACMQQRLHEEL
ncbi:MAG: sigma-70 family RNA polymerase sigma factor [Planctomycetota bacterium]|nr:MAG: sigma-70 family RNA polymerase sigma factor [Planctomycetota bacterium]